jgi:hypothetical protein
MKAILLIQCLGAVGAAAAALPRGAITGSRTSEVETNRERKLRGSITAAQNGDVARKLPSAADNRKRGELNSTE